MKQSGQRCGNLSLGQHGEDIAVRYLTKLKYSIIERNYRSKCGELDIVARDGKTLVFVEVKTRRSKAFGSPLLSVTPFKQRQISKAALVYMAAKKVGQVSARFDVIAVEFDNSSEPHVNHIKNAFDLAY